MWIRGVIIQLNLALLDVQERVVVPLVNQLLNDLSQHLYHHSLVINYICANEFVECIQIKDIFLWLILGIDIVIDWWLNPLNLLYSVLKYNLTKWSNYWQRVLFIIPLLAHSQNSGPQATSNWSQSIQSNLMITDLLTSTDIDSSGIVPSKIKCHLWWRQFYLLDISIQFNYVHKLHSMK